MKKSLALILALAMIFAMFTPAVFAEEQEATTEETVVEERELTTEEKYEALLEAGIFSGHADGTAGLEENMTRAQAAVVVSELFDLDITNPPASASFSDVDSSHWAYAQIEAAAAAGIINGRTNGEFDPGTVEEVAQGIGNVTSQEMAIMLTLAFNQIYGLDINADGSVQGTVAPWAEQYVAAALEAGLIPVSSNYTNYATRAQLVEATYAAAELRAELEVPSVASYTIVDRNNVTFTMTDGVEVEVELEEGLNANEETEVTFTYDEREITHTVVWEVEQGIADFSAIGASKLEVVFAGAVDEDEVEVAVTRGTSNASVAGEWTFAEDGASAVLETSSRLTAATYTVTVTFAEDVEFSESIEVEAERVESIEFTNAEVDGDQQAPMAREADGTPVEDQILAWIVVENQYGEDVTNRQYGNLNVNASRAESISHSNGELTITGTSDFRIGEPVTVTALHRDSALFESATLYVSAPSRIASVEIEGLYHEEDKELKENSTASEYFLKISAVDQYGNTVQNEDYVNNDVFLSNLNPSIIDIHEDEVVEVDEQLAIQLDSPDEGLRAGTTTITILSNTTGNRASHDVTVAAVPGLDTLTLTAPEFAVAGEEIEIPFVAVDQFGNELQNDADNLDVLRDGVVNGFSLASRYGYINFEADYVNDRVKLIWNTTAIAEISQNQPVYISGITEGNKTFNVQVVLRPHAEPQGLSDISGFKSALAQGAKTKIENKNVKVEDQHGRSVVITDFSGYTVEYTSSAPGVVSVSGNELTAVSDGTATITAQLYDAAGEEVGEEFRVRPSVRVVKDSAIVDYEVGAVGNIYGGSGSNADYNKSLTINGKLSDGTLVALPEAAEGEYFEVTVTGDVYNLVGYDAASSKLVPVNTVASDKEFTGNVIVTGYTNNGNSVNIEVEVTVSGKAPKAATLALRDADALGATKASDGVVSISAGDLAATNATALANGVVKVTDQYGVEIKSATKFRTVTAGNVNFADQDAGDSFTVTAIAQSGERISFTVQVTN